MKIRIWVPTLALAMAPMLLAGAKAHQPKSYDIILDSPAQAGKVQLAAGEYKLKVEGGNAEFTSVNTGKRYTTPVEVKDTGKKIDDTMVDMTTSGGATHVRAIELGGSTTEVDFE